MKNTVLMTKGSISKNIIKFAVPIFFGNVFQQLYNFVDSIILGNFVGKEALAAVTSSSSMIFLFVGFISGIFMGAGVVISRYYGAEDNETVSKAIHTNIAFAVFAGIALTVIGLILTPHILVWMKTPDSVISSSLIYVRIYFGGIMSVVLYNAASSVYQAVGDTKHPLIFLIVASLINVTLDLIFVGLLKWGIAGAAAATVIAQTTSFLLAIGYLMRSKDVYHIDIKKIRINKDLLKEIIKMGIPAGVQNSVIGLANMVVQFNINIFDDVAMAGCGAYSRIEGFVFVPIMSFNFSLTTFVSQNLGAGEYERVKKGVRFGILTSMVLAESVGLLFFLFAPKLIAIFNADPEVIAFGSKQAHIEALFYFLLAFSHSVSAVLRGAGKSFWSMVVMLGCWCVFRVTYLTVVISIIQQIEVVFWGYPLTWFLSSFIFFFMLFFSKWQKGFSIKKEPALAFPPREDKTVR